MKPSLIMMVGLPGVGKSSLARRLERIARLNAPAPALFDSRTPGVIRVNRDELRAMAHGGWIGNGGEERITVLQAAGVRALLAAGCQVVVDDTNLNPSARERWRVLADQEGATLRVWDLTGVPLQACLQRNDGRAGAARLDPDMIRAKHERYIVPLGGRPVIEAEPWLRD